VSAHKPSLAPYLAVFLALMVLTAVTVWVAFIDMGAMNDVVAMAIASLKASLVIIWFMHVKHSTRLTKITIWGSLLFLVLLIGFILMDVETRGFLVEPGRELPTPSFLR